jgi:hypothetical protein
MIYLNVKDFPVNICLLNHYQSQDEVKQCLRVLAASRYYIPHTGPFKVDYNLITLPESVFTLLDFQTSIQYIEKYRYLLPGGKH